MPCPGCGRRLMLRHQKRTMAESQIHIASGPAGSKASNRAREGKLSWRRTGPKPTPAPAVSGEPSQVEVSDPQRGVRCTAAPSAGRVPADLHQDDGVGKWFFFCLWLATFLCFGTLAFNYRSYSPPTSVEGVARSFVTGQDVWIVAWLRRKLDSYVLTWQSGRPVAAVPTLDKFRAWQARVFAFGFVATFVCWRVRHLTVVVIAVIVVAYGPGFLWGLPMPT